MHIYCTKKVASNQTFDVSVHKSWKISFKFTLRAVVYRGGNMKVAHPDSLDKPIRRADNPSQALHSV